MKVASHPQLSSCVTTDSLVKVPYINLVVVGRGPMNCLYFMYVQEQFFSILSCVQVNKLTAEL